MARPCRRIADDYWDNEWRSTCSKALEAWPGPALVTGSWTHLDRVRIRRKAVYLEKADPNRYDKIRAGN